MAMIREPYVEIDLTVQYSSIDLRPEPNTPIVGIVLRSDYYANYYYSLSERERLVNRKAIEINSKRDYLTKIVRGNYILPSDHLSLKNGYYLAGTVRLYVAPEIPKTSYANQPYGLPDGYPNNVKFAATFFTTIVRHKSGSPSHDIMGFWVKDNDNVSIWFGSPVVYGIFNGSLNISGNPPMLTVGTGSTNHNVAFIGINDNVYPIRTVAFVEFYTMPIIFPYNPHILVLTDEYLIFFQAADHTGSNYKVFVLAKISTDLSQLRDTMMNIQRIKFYKDTTNNAITPVDTGISITFSIDNALLNDFDTLFSSNPSNYYYYLSYIVANPSLSGTYDYSSFLYGHEYNWGGQYYSLDHIMVLGVKDNNGLNWVFTFYDYEWDDFLSTTTISSCGAITFSGNVISHNVSLTNTGSGCDINVQDASEINISCSSAIGRVKYVVEYKIAYSYDLETFSEALELLNMADLIPDNGYCSSRTDYRSYASMIAEFAAEINVDKVPALAVINLPFNIGASVAENIIPPTAASSTFLCAGYFRNESLGYPTMLPVSSLYVQRVVSMYSILNAFSPIYNRPLMPLAPIDRIYSEREREILLSKRINSLKPYEGSWTFNNNLTATMDNSIFKEENIRRLANTVARELMQLLKKFLGMQNTGKTRAQVVSLIKRMKEVIIDPHEYKPDEFIIVCDETNNRDFDRYLYVTIIVRMPLSIKYIELVTVAIDLEMT
jgi:hypothetical protein